FLNTAYSADCITDRFSPTCSHSEDPQSVRLPAAADAQHPAAAVGRRHREHCQVLLADIAHLYDCQLRLMHNIQPLPSGVDIANTVKYFSQTFLIASESVTRNCNSPGVLKDVPRSPLEMIRDADNDADRMALYPNLDYKGLFNAISQLVDSAPHLQYGIQGCLLPFLEYDMIDNLPYLVAYCVAVFPVALHQEILNLLCYYILPFTITRKYAGQEEESQASQSLLECLMSMKQSVLKDVLCVIAYGTWGARLSAAKLLFYYWPPFDAKLFDRKGLLCKFSNDLVPFLCQRDQCPNAGSAEAAKVCYDHCISVTFASDTPPPLYLCIECANEIHRLRFKELDSMTFTGEYLFQNLIYSKLHIDDLKLKTGLDGVRK
ncbi:Uncharacterized protein OBRU01_18968, partial [Operophtera brumata]